MAAVISNFFRLHNAEQFKEAFNETSPTKMYLFVGRTMPWANDSAPTTPLDTVQYTNYNVWKHMLAAKKILAADVSHCIPKYNWTNNTFYTEYSNLNSTLSSNNFYVLTDENNVYKCLFNNRNANSTVKPTGTTTALITGSDKYIWKFMYNLSTAETTKFVTSNYIPVKTLIVDDGSAQWDVQQASTNGSIDIIDISANGTSYDTTSNSFSYVTNSTFLTLKSNASGSDDKYVGSTLYISSGKGSGQIREIIDYIGANNTVRVNTAFVTVPNTSSEYIIGPKIKITGDGSGALAYANVTSGQVKEITVISGGQNYSNATVTISANAGSGAVAIPYIPPPGGHGSNPVQELYGHNIIMYVKISGRESNNVTVNNDFRIIGLLRDPLNANGTTANGSIYDQTVTLTVTGLANGIFQEDEQITGSSSKATGTIVDFKSNTTIRVLSTSQNNFSTADNLASNTSGATANVTAVALGDLKPYSGDVIYIEHREPITRDNEQRENIKLIINF